MCSYLFVAMAYGMMMQEAGFAWYDSLLASLTIYTGAFQFVLITFLSSGASVLTIAVTALLMNSRQAFYSLSFVDEFKKMGRKMPYMIHTMTDETYAVNCTLTEQGEERRGIMFFVALFSRCYWMIGAVAVVCLLIVGPSAFMLPALIIVSGILLIQGKKEEAWMEQGKIIGIILLCAAIMAVLIVYCLKDVRTDFGGRGICQLIAVAVVAFSYKWKHNTFISIIAGTACYMILLAM